MSERIQPRIQKPGTALKVAGSALLAVSFIGANTIDAPVAISKTGNPRPSSGELNTSNSLTPENITENLARLNITPEIQGAMSQEFDAIYQIIKAERFIDAGDGALRVQYGQDRDSDLAALEYQAFGELLAIYSGDFETAERLMRFDDRYKYANTGESNLPDGLTPWEVHLTDVGNEKDVAKIWEGKKRKKDGEVNWADMTDPTVVSNVMMYMALARTLHVDTARQAEGQEIFDIMAANGMIESGNGKNVPQAFHWADSEDLTNPAYLSVVLMETAARVSPDWINTASDTKEFLGKIDERIRNGEYAAAPNWTDIDGKPRNNESSKPVINYDIAYFVLNNLHTAIYSEDPTSRDDAISHLDLVSAFFQDKIAIKDGAGNVTGYDSSQLKDGYKLDGSLDESEDRYSDTAFTTAAFMASLVSGDEAYRAHMLETFRNLDKPTWEPINDLFNVAAAGLIGGRFYVSDEPTAPIPTPEATVTPSITTEPTQTPEATQGIIESEIKLKPGEVIEHGDRSKPEIFFTIDDGWDIEEMEQILKIAEKYNVKLTLFPTGDSVDANPEFYYRAHKKGHSIQNHSKDHPSGIDKFSAEDLREQITSQLNSVRRALRDPNYVQHSFRPPEGVGAPPWYSVDKGMQKVLKDMGLAFGMFTSVSEAWNGDTGREVERKLSRDIQNGSIIVLHDEKADIAALPGLIEKALAAGLKPVTMDEIFKDN